MTQYNGNRLLTEVSNKYHDVRKNNLREIKNLEVRVKSSSSKLKRARNQMTASHLRGDLGLAAPQSAEARWYEREIEEAKAEIVRLEREIESAKADYDKAQNELKADEA